MHIQVIPDDLWKAHFDPGVTEAVCSAISAYNREVEQLVAQDFIEFPEMLEGTSIFTLIGNPLTVLDPAHLPPEPYEDPKVDPMPEVDDPDEIRRRYEAWRQQCEPYGGDEIVYQLLMFNENFNPDNQPFTWFGYWTDGDVSGAFGYLKGDHRITVLFC